MALNYTTGASRKNYTTYIDKDGNRTALTSPYVTSGASAGRQYAAAKQDAVSNYYKNKAVNNQVNGLWPGQVVAIPAETDTYTVPYANISSAVNRDKVKTTSSGSGSGSGTATNAYAPYVEQLNALYDKMMNKGKFRYDLNADLLYQQMADQYTQLGQQAMKDTMGQAAALTGGYGNSYAQQVGNQAYQQYLTALNQQIPELYDRAYQAYHDDLDWLLQQYQLTAAHPEYLQAMTPSAGGGTTAQNANTGTSAAEIMAYLNSVNGNNANSGGTGGSTSGAAAANAYNNELAKWYYKLLNQ